MKVAVFGSTGMLGRKVSDYLQQEGHTVYQFNRQDGPIFDYPVVETLLRDCNPERVVNCAGIIGPKMTYAAEMVAVNALGPHVLSFVCEQMGVPMIHVSTDCVFSGHWRPEAGRHSSTMRPDPIDLYGRSKLCGEVQASHVTNVRTSFVGLEHGLLRWVIDQSLGSTIEGWKNALWTGSTVNEVVRKLVPLIVEPTGRIEHLATMGVLSKLIVVQAIKEVFKLDINIEVNEEVHINRALSPTIVLAPITDVLGELRGEYRDMLTSGAKSLS